MLRHSVSRQLHRVRLSIDDDSAANAVRYKTQSSLCMRKLMRKEYEDVVRQLSHWDRVSPLSSGRHRCQGTTGKPKQGGARVRSPMQLVRWLGLQLQGGQ